MGKNISIHALLAESDHARLPHVVVDCDFYPRSPCGERHQSRLSRGWRGHFYPRSPCGERQRIHDRLMGGPAKISIHALLAESDWMAGVDRCRPYAFLSTLSLRRATTPAAAASASMRYFYPRSPCGERQLSGQEQQQITAISIHALLAESDTYRLRITGATRNFYPRSPCGERPWQPVSNCTFARFLSTLSLRRATAVPPVLRRRQKYFYPRSPCGERRAQGRQNTAGCEISIHALLAESDVYRGTVQKKYGISIHALLAESDGVVPNWDNSKHGFLSTLSLRRATGLRLRGLRPQNGFLSTLSLRRATAKVHKTVGHFCTYETNFMEIASSC